MKYEAYNFHLGLIILLGLIHAAAFAKDPTAALRVEHRLNGREVTKAFEPIITHAKEVTATIHADSKSVALGTVMTSDGFILTKASSLADASHFGVSLADGRSFRARLLALDEDNDLALLRIHTEGLPSAKLTNDPPPVVGRWVAVPVPSDPFILIGMTSATTRQIESEGGVLGIVLEFMPPAHQHGVAIENVQPGSGAMAAGLQIGDVVTHISGERTPSRETLITAVLRHRPGQIVRVTYRRNGRVERVDVVLGYRTVVFEDVFFDRNEPINGETSLRKNGFELVIQHHIPISATLCGGPLVDSKGQIIGLNIARANRSETFALPASLINQLLPKMIREAKRHAKKNKTEDGSG